MGKILKVEAFGDQIRLVEYLHFNPFSGRSSAKKGKVRAVDEECELGLDCDELSSPEGAPEGRFRQSIQRAKSRVREYALCNEWDWFCTFTLNEQKQDRFNLRQWARDFGVWIGNYNKKYGANLRYLIVPEQHKNGAWHCHGLLAGVSPESLATNEHGYLTMPYYANRFGFINLSQISDKSKCASYVAKYITKGGASVGKNEHMFYTSRGLNKREFVEYLTVGDGFESDWRNEWCGISWRTIDEYCALSRALRVSD